MGNGWKSTEENTQLNLPFDNIYGMSLGFFKSGVAWVRRHYRMLGFCKQNLDHVTVKQLIELYSYEELRIRITDSETGMVLCPYFWKTDYVQKCFNGHYIYKSLHKYDQVQVTSWAIEDGALIIEI